MLMEVHDRDGERQGGKASIPLNTNKQGTGGTRHSIGGRAQQATDLNARALGWRCNAFWRWMGVDLWHEMSVESHRCCHENAKVSISNVSPQLTALSAVAKLLVQVRIRII